MRFGTAWEGVCVLVDGQYDLELWTLKLVNYYKAIGWCAVYYADVKDNPNFSLNRFDLIILSLPDQNVSDGFVAEQWSSISSWNGRRVYIGTDWKGEGAYELLASDTTNAMGTGMLVLDDAGASPVVTGNYEPESDDLMSGVSEISTTSADEITGGTDLCNNGTTSFLRKNVVSGLEIVMCGTPGLTGQMTDDNKTFFRNLALVPRSS